MNATSYMMSYIKLNEKKNKFSYKKKKATQMWLPSFDDQIILSSRIIANAKFSKSSDT